MNCDIDHLVIGAASLAQGQAWCEATFGVAPGPGGQHPLMGTHNRLLDLRGPGFDRVYLEIIAIDPAAPPPGRRRWFGLDDPAVQARLAAGPALLGAVVRTPNVEMLRWGLVHMAQDPGPALAAERDTPAGRLAWRILVRDDGAWPGGGRLPTLIEWQGRHPADHLPSSPLSLKSACFGAITPREAQLLRLRGVQVTAGGPSLQVVLAGPRGETVLTVP